MMSLCPNMIVFFTDQQRWDCSGLHGNPLGLMPTFDAMAQRGTHCFNAFTPQPLCGPARACVQTGQYATTNGCFRNEIPLSEDVDTLANVFRQNGYATAYIGKWHLAAQEPVPEHKRGGYEYWLGADKLEFTSEPYHTVLYDNDGQSVELPGYRVDALTDAAIRYVDDRVHHYTDRPFFLFLSFLEPHQQNHLDDYVPPDGYREPYTGRWTPPDLQALGGSTAQHLGGYWGTVKRLDEALGRLLDALKSLRIRDNTIVLFTSDHGCHFGTRPGVYKRTAHESSIRVPLAIDGPGFVGGGRVRELVSLVDVFPTLVDAAGLQVSASVQGHSILPLLRRDTVEWRDGIYVQTSETELGRAIRTQRWKYGVTAPDADARQEPTAQHYVETFLFDLEADPYELTNLIGFESHRELADQLQDRLLARMAANDEPPATIEKAIARPSGRRRVDSEDYL